MKRAFASLLFAATAAAQLSFEVALIKPNNSGYGGDDVNTTNGSLTMRNVSLRMIVEDAYDLKRYTLTAPDWLDTQRFDISSGPSWSGDRLKCFASPPTHCCRQKAGSS
jgi:hypothetical protein